MMYVQASLPPAYLLVLAEMISSTLKMEAIRSSEKSVATQQTTRHHIPEDDTLHNHRGENLKSYIERSFAHIIGMFRARYIRVFYAFI
jgi:hypothetical protein